MIRAEHKRIPYVILRLAGVYDEHSLVPTMAQQMARIYERDFQSYFYSGSTLVGQAMLHRDDMLEAFRRAVDRRDVLPQETEILIGEPDAIGYDALQDELGELIHGVDDWPTLRVPKPVAAAGAWAQDGSSRSSPTRSTGASRRSSNRSWSRWPTTTMRSTFGALAIFSAGSRGTD